MTILSWRGEYYLYDFQWRSGLACQITGATSLLSSEVSLMLMALISADRLKNIVFPFRAAYLAIFISRVQVKNQSANTRRETGLAKRLFFIIFTDCLCWMPIIVFGLRSVLEKMYKTPGDLAVWIAVFALPINSAINPILYTLATRKV
ncbi:relaxin receptor 2-like [Stylophora pistillata]|uniref:relaxin receptor 2-like n=1 Tax=Stylophora pistillata TaxID=50429 RepID=UPI000C03AC15|nr:relaxin receptor 2-like [Stylophora pistillata]